MPTLRKTPALSNNGGVKVNDDTYAEEVNANVVALWARNACWLNTVAGTNTITASADAPLTAVPTRPNSFILSPAGANTGAVTLNIDSTGALAVTDINGVALGSGALQTLSIGASIPRLRQLPSRYLLRFSRIRKLSILLVARLPLGLGRSGRSTRLSTTPLLVARWQRIRSPYPRETSTWSGAHQQVASEATYPGCLTLPVVRRLHRANRDRHPVARIRTCIRSGLLRLLHLGPLRIELSTGAILPTLLTGLDSLLTSLPR